MKINNHLLEGENIDQSQRTPNISGEISPDTIVVHYTAGRDAASSVRTLCDPDAKASAHLVIGRDGAIFQLAPFNIKTWHAGKSEYQGRTGFNKYSIGIEIDNAGVLEKSGTIYRSWFGKSYPEEDVLQAVHRNETTAKYWHRYSEIQIELVETICWELIKSYPNIEHILGHEEISPKRKIDPGPAFPLDKLRNKIFSVGRDEDGAEEDEFPFNGIVNASKLNIRADASGSGEKVAQPLPKGTKLKVLSESNGWYKVRAEVEGWVFGDYVERKDN